MLYTADQLVYPRKFINNPGFLITPYVPAKSKVVLLHGPGGVGKSALLWSMANAIEAGSSIFGLETRKAKTLVISTDMNLYEIDQRWSSKFCPQFAVEIVDPFDCTHPGFPVSDLYKRCQKYAKDNNVEVVFIDTLGKVHFRDARLEETVALVYQSLTKWFPHITIVGNFHNKKPLRDPGGNEIITEDDFRGSRKWADDAVSQLHMRKVGGEEYHSQLFHTKSQISVKADPIELYIDVNGNVELWNQGRADKVAKQYAEVVASYPPETPIKTLNEKYSEKHDVTLRHTKRIRAMYLNNLKKQKNNLI